MVNLAMASVVTAEAMVNVAPVMALDINSVR